MVVVCFIYYKTRNLKTITMNNIVNARTNANSAPSTNNPLNSALASATNVVANAIKK